MQAVIVSASENMGKALAKALGLTCVHPYQVRDDQLVINYGSHEITSRVPRQNMLNNTDIVKQFMNKTLASLTMFERGVSTPPFYTSLEINTNDLPLLGRSEYHSKGKGCFFCLNRMDLIEAANQGCSIFFKLVDKADEYRVFVFLGEVLSVKKRVPTGKKTSNWVWNYDQGWEMWEIATELVPLDVREEAMKAVAALGLDFGAVDIGVDFEGRPCVFEVNTGPGLNEESASFKLMVERMSAWLKEKGWSGTSSTITPTQMELTFENWLPSISEVVESIVESTAKAGGLLSAMFGPIMRSRPTTSASSSRVSSSSR